MRQLYRLTITVIAFGCASANAQDWTKYVNLDDRFIVNFPGEPEIREFIYTSEYAAMMPAQVYTVADDSGRYSVTVVDYTNAEQALRERPDDTYRGDDLTSDVLGSIAYAATNLRKRGGEITYDAWAAVDRIAGHQLQITNLDKSRTFAGIYLHASRLYILEATVPEGWPPPGHFQQSLGILDAQGKRVRYELDVDGRRTRVETSYEWTGSDEPELGNP
jgi:hypothetical protein